MKIANKLIKLVGMIMFIGPLFMLIHEGTLPSYGYIVMGMGFMAAVQEWDK